MSDEPTSHAENVDKLLADLLLATETLSKLENGGSASTKKRVNEMIKIINDKLELALHEIANCADISGYLPDYE